MQTNKHIILSGNTAWSMFNFRKNLILSLLQNGYKISIISPKDTFSDKLIALGCNFYDIKIDSNGTNPFNDLFLIFQYYKLLKKLNPDFIFFYTIKPNIYGSIAAGILKIPHIAITTGLGSSLINNGFISKITKILYKLSLNSALQIWFLNNDDMGYFLKHKIIPSKKSKILNGEGINTEKYTPPNYIIHEQNKSVSFILIARMLWEKGIGEYVAAAKRLKIKYPHTQYKLLGFINNDNQFAITTEQIKEWDSNKIINYLGTTENVIPYLIESSCVVLPSYYREGIPMCLLEAASMAKPIITTDNVGCKETIDDNVTGYLCKARDVESLYNTMEKIILMKNEDRVKMGVAGRFKVLNEFDEKLIINQYLETLNKFEI